MAEWMNDLQKKQWRTFTRNRIAVIGMFLSLGMLLMAVFAPQLSTFDPLAQDIHMRLHAPDGPFVLGTDDFGRDVLSRIFWGARISLTIGIGSVLFGMVLGSAMGMLAGLRGGRLGAFIMRCADTMMCFPAEILAILILVVLGQGVDKMLITIGLVMTPRFARLSYGSTLALREREFIEADLALGASTLYVLRPAAAKGLLPEAYVKVARDSFPEVGTLPRVPEADAANPYLAQARHYIEQRGQTDMRNILIDTVYVTHHKRLESTRPEHRLAAHTWDMQQIKEMGAYSIMEFVQRMPGMNFIGGRLSYHGANVSFMIDGVLDNTTTPHSADADFQAGSTIGQLIVTGTKKKSMTEIALERGGLEPDKNLTMPICTTWPMEWVSRIDLIAGGNMFLWGVFDGAIVSITTKTGDELDQALAVAPAIDVSIASPLGYQTPAEFYAPAYATEKARRSMVPDYRTTLYWNPTVKLDDTGQATVEFYTSDAPADYDISIEGVTQTGKIVQRRQRLLPE